MPKVLRCHEVVAGCSEVIHGQTEDELMRRAAEHLRDKHGEAPLPLDVVAAVRAAIREDGAPEPRPAPPIKDPVPDNIRAEHDAEARTLDEPVRRPGGAIEVPENNKADTVADALTAADDEWEG